MLSAICAQTIFITVGRENDTFGVLAFPPVAFRSADFHFVPSLPKARSEVY